MSIILDMAITIPTDEEKEKTIEEMGYYLLMDSITISSCREAIKFILKANLLPKKPPHLTLVICSYGGDVNAGFALVDTIKGSSIPIHTVGLGSIASCGLVIFMAGEKGHRLLTPNTSILSHQWAWGSYGKEHELFATVKEFELITKRVIAHYKKCTGLPEKIIREKLLPPQDVWLEAKDALELGICDQIKAVY